MIPPGKFLLLGGLGAVMLYGAVTGFQMWLVRPTAGLSCTNLTPTEVAATGLDFTPRFTLEKGAPPVLVRAAGGQPDPDCMVSGTALRCTQTGPATVMVAKYGSAFYFDVPPGETAILFGRSHDPLCVLSTDPAESG